MKRPKVGAPTKLTPQSQKVFMKIIKRSGFYKDACGAIGIDTDTLAEWRKKGAAGLQPYAGFTEALQKAERDRRQAYFDQSEKRGAKKHDTREIQWRAAVTDPEVFSIKHHLVVQQQIDVVINRVKEVFRDRPLILEEILSTIAGESRSGGAGGDETDPGLGLAPGGDLVDPLKALAEAAGVPGADG